jgi:hypothetical protein
MLQGFAGNHPCNIPLGSMLEFTGTTVPNGDFVRSFGRAISRRNDDTGGLGGELWANGATLGPLGHVRINQLRPARLGVFPGETSTRFASADIG